MTRTATPSQLSMLDLKVGRTYRGVRPGNAQGLVNDRTIKWIGDGLVQFDGPAVGLGRHLPKIPAQSFLNWAHHDVTDELPPGEYQFWLDYKAKIKAEKDAAKIPAQMKRRD